jgi:hypothetical protein
MATVPKPKLPANPKNPTAKELEQAKIDLKNYKQAMGLFKIGSDEYNQYVDIVQSLNNVIKAAGDVTKAASTKKKDASIQSQIDDLQREIDSAPVGTDIKPLQDEQDNLKKKLSTYVPPVGKEPKVKTTAVPPGAKVKGNQVFDPMGKQIGTTTDGKVMTPLAPEKTTDTKGSNKGGNKTPAPTAADTKTTWINYLRETFKNVGDPTAQAQIDAIFKQASAPNSGWTETTFLEALNNVKWWSDQLPSLRAYFITSHDPRQAGTLKEARIQKQAAIEKNLADLGIAVNNVDPATGKLIDNSKILSGLVEKAIANNWSDAQIQHYVATNADFHFTSGGLIQNHLDAITKNSNLYGITLDPVLKQSIQTDLADPTSGRDYNYWNNQMKQMAMDTYKPFAKAIADGGNLYTATYNYRTQMANLLEVAQDAISWKDLMGGVIDSNTGNARTQDDFIRQVKQNPLWQKTANARQTYMGVANDLMSMFGITG